VGSLDGRVALVTGAGRGIGAAIAEGLAAEGARVVVNDLGSASDGAGSDRSAADETVWRIRARGGDAVASAADVADHRQVGDLVDQTVRDLGDIHIVVNAAGILRDRMIFNLAEEDWDAVIRVHLNGHFNTIRHTAAHWRAHRDGDPHRRIINVTSISALHGAAGQPNYAAAKLGVVGLTYSCANALVRYGVTANAISPGANTRLTNALSDSQRLAGPTEREELAPERVAPVVSYLAGPDSGWLNGRVVDVRGNRVALYSIPEQIRVIRSREPWDVASVGQAMRKEFYRAAQAPLEMPT
jgi:NAD(P)-dependent dehydrogenase (short-subunit alcohol dehydrogenase family)